MHRNSPGRTVFENAPTEMMMNDNGDSTNLIFADQGGAKVSYRLTLTDKNDPGKVFECELKDTVIVGRKSDVTDLAINVERPSKFGGSYLLRKPSAWISSKSFRREYIP